MMREFNSMMKLAMLLISFGAAIFFSSSIIWSVVERCSQKSFSAISQFFDQSENQGIRESWRSYMFPPEVIDCDTAIEATKIPEYVPTSNLRHFRSITDTPLEVAQGPKNMVKI
jgi:hypothetical protein